MSIIHSRGGSQLQFYDPDTLKGILINAGSDINPGDTFEIEPGTDMTGLLTINIHADYSGTRNNPIKVTGSGWTGYTEIVGVTWAAPAAWVGGAGYVVGDVVEESGSFYNCTTDHTADASVFANDAANWQVIGGTVWWGDLTELSTPPSSTFTFVSIDDALNYSQRPVGENSIGNARSPIFRQDLEWGAGPNLWAPEKFWIRSDSGAPGAGGPASIKVAQNYGIFRFNAGVNYWLFEDITATDLGCVAGGQVADGATADILGLTMRRVNTTRCGGITRIGAESTTEGGQQATVREWLIEDCHVVQSCRGTFSANNAGSGVIRGCSETDGGLAYSTGAFYLSSSGAGLGPGGCVDSPDDVYVVDCWAFGTGLYTEQGGVGNYFENDHHGNFYCDGRVKNIHFIGCGSKGNPLQYSGQNNAGGGHNEWIGLTAIEPLKALTVDDSTLGGNGTTAIYNSSFVNAPATGNITYGGTATGAHTIYNVAGHNVGDNVKPILVTMVPSWVADAVYAVNDLVENDTDNVYICTTAGTAAASGGPTGTGTGIADGPDTLVWDYYSVRATVDVDNCEFEGLNLAGPRGGSGNAYIDITDSVNATSNGDTDTVLFESLTSARVPAGSALIDAGRALIESPPALVRDATAEDCWLVHGGTSNDGFTIAMTVSHAADSNDEIFELGDSNDSQHQGFLTAAVKYAHNCRTAATDHYGADVYGALTANAEYRLVYRWDGAGTGTSDGWVNGTKQGSNADDHGTYPTITSGTPPAGTLNIGNTVAGGNGINGTFRDVVLVDLVLTDAECEIL